jgi:decaprenylphospho-beta-D-ribofuranose 2-oxidase
MAMDFPVPAERNALTALTDTMTQIVLKAGGRFYMAKDSVLRPEELKAAYGDERLAKFRALKADLDPDGLFETALSKRLELSR